jgi:hypothetical protein
MKIFFNVKNPYYKGFTPKVGDIIRLYNNTYIISLYIENDLYEMKDICNGNIVIYSLRRRPFEILISNECKKEISSKLIIIKNENIISNYLDNINNKDDINKKIYTSTILENNYSSYCSIM